MTAVKKWFGGITLFKVSIESRRKKLLKDPDVLALLKSLRISTLMGEDFETWLKSMSK